MNISYINLKRENLKKKNHIKDQKEKLNKFLLKNAVIHEKDVTRDTSVIRSRALLFNIELTPTISQAMAKTSVTLQCG